MTTVPKKADRLLLFTKTLIHFFLSLKHPHALTFFLHSLHHSLVDKKILEKKNTQSFFMRHFNERPEYCVQLSIQFYCYCQKTFKICVFIIFYLTL